MKEHIPVFCATDENYAPFASIMMKSLLSHTKSFIDFYVMDGGITKKTKKLIDKDLKNFPNKTIRYIDMSPYDLKRFPNLAHFSANTFSRYFIPEIAPDLKRAIYLDVDMTIKGDIADLFHQDLDGHALGAMAHLPSTFMSMRLKKKTWPDYHSESAYFNAGTLLMDIPKLIEMDFTQKAIDLTDMLYDKLIYPDQDVMNIIFENNYKILDFRFNFVNYAPWYEEVKKTVPVVVHHCSLKPWKLNSIYQQDFEEVLHNSIFYPIILKKYRARQVKYSLFGWLPIFKKYVPKDIFLNQSFVEKKL